MLGKVYVSADEALNGLLSDGMLIASGGFGMCGAPCDIIDGIVRANPRNLTLVANNCGLVELGLGRLLEQHQLKKIICSYVGDNQELVRQYMQKKLEIEFCPQGTLAEKMRAGGAGIPAFYTPTGVGTAIAEGKDHKEFNGKAYILENSIVADLAIVHAWKVDESGNAIFRKTARNFNVPAAMCGQICVLEAEHIVPVGSLDPDQIHLPGIYVHRIIQAKAEKIIEQRTTR